MFSTVLLAEPLRVATLHPLLTELAQTLGGEQVEVLSLLPPNANPHSFDPKPSELTQLQQVNLVLAMGKNLEPYLDRIKANLPAGVNIYEVGRPVPSVVIDPRNATFACCPRHMHGAVDPHWWQSPQAMRRATRHLGKELEKLLPEHKAVIRERTRAHMDVLAELDQWIEGELNRVPKRQRILVTAHAAFGYFCDVYGFQALPVKGLAGDQSATPAELGESIEILKENKIRAVFPEIGGRNHNIHALQEATGIKLGEPLLADNINSEDTSYVDMMKHNTNSIVAALGEKETP